MAIAPSARIHPTALVSSEAGIGENVEIGAYAIIEGPVTVPLAAFKFADGGPSIETPPPRLGQHTDEVLESLGYTRADIAALRQEGAI